MKNEIEKEIKEEKVYKSMSDIEKKDPVWLWYPYIPMNMVTIIQGDPKCGKTYMLLDIISRITRGDKKPFSEERFEVGNVILQNNDDPLDYTLAKRLDQQGADRSKVFFVDESKKQLYFNNLSRLEKTIEEVNPSLIVFDPLQSFLGDININSQIEVRNALAPLKDIAEKYNCAIVLVQHLKKGSESKAIYKGVGSIDFIGFARSTIMIMKDKDNKEKRLFVPTSSNVEKEGHSLSYRITNNGLEWLDDLGEIDADELIKEEADTKIEYAKNFILGCLSNNELILGNDLIDKGVNIGKFAKRTFDEARSRLNKNDLIDEVIIDKAHYWKLKDKVQSDKVSDKSNSSSYN